MHNLDQEFVDLCKRHKKLCEPVKNKAIELLEKQDMFSLSLGFSIISKAGRLRWIDIHYSDKTYKMIVAAIKHWLKENHLKISIFPMELEFGGT